MGSDRFCSPSRWRRPWRRDRTRSLVSLSVLLILPLAASTVTFGAAAGAQTASVPGPQSSPAAVHGGRIDDGSQWTLFSEAVFQGGCTVVTFATQPDQVDDDIGDQGRWNGGKTSVALHFLSGAESHPYGLAPGVFHGKFVKGSDFFSGSFRPTKPRGGSNTASLVPGAAPDC
jgi:hypothetical protein